MANLGSDVLLWVINGLLAILAFFGIFIINRLATAVDNLAKQDTLLQAQLALHREDMLKNYVRQAHLEPLKKDIIGRVDRLEGFFTKSSEAQEERVAEQMDNLRKDIRAWISKGGSHD